MEKVFTPNALRLLVQNLSDRWEVQYSYTDHHQDSFYGDMAFQAKERIAFIQGIWRKKIGKHRVVRTKYSL